MESIRPELSGKRALVTGASGAIGRSLSIALAQAGADVALLGRNKEKLAQVGAEIQALGRDAYSVTADLTEATQVEQAVAEVARRGGKIDILVNSAGAQARKPALDFTEEDWDRVLNVNLKSVFFTCQAVARVMSKHGGGAIVNVGSLVSVIGLPHLSAYCASKGGVGQLTKSLAVEWAPLGIRVNAMAPGRIRTPMTEDLFQNEAIRESFVRLIPLGRAGTPEELGGAVVFLASDASRYMTGQIIYVDGGWLASGGNPAR